MSYPIISRRVVEWFSNMDTDDNMPCADINLFELGRDIGNSDDPMGILAEIVRGIEAGQKEWRR